MSNDEGQDMVNVAHSPSQLLAEVDSKREGGVAMLVEMLIGLHVGLCFAAKRRKLQ